MRRCPAKPNSQHVIQRCKIIYLEGWWTKQSHINIHISQRSLLKKLLSLSLPTSWETNQDEFQSISTIFESKGLSRDQVASTAATWAYPSSEQPHLWYAIGTVIHGSVGQTGKDRDKERKGRMEASSYRKIRMGERNWRIWGTVRLWYQRL